jgi:hypothetical protein
MLDIFSKSKIQMLSIFKISTILLNNTKNLKHFTLNTWVLAMLKYILSKRIRIWRVFIFHLWNNIFSLTQNSLNGNFLNFAKKTQRILCIWCLTLKLKRLWSIFKVNGFWFKQLWSFLGETKCNSLKQNSLY